MGVRIRKDRKTIVCEAESEPMDGDCYITDNLHYTLVAEMEVLHTDDEGETWYFDTTKKKKYNR